MCLPPITVVNSPSKRHFSRPRSYDPPPREPLLQPLSPEAYGAPAPMPPTGVVTALPSAPRCPVPVDRRECMESHHPCHERARAYKEEKPQKKVVYVKEAINEDRSACSCSSKKRCACDHRRRRRSSTSSSSSRSLREVKRRIRHLWERVDLDRYREDIERSARREDLHRTELDLQRDRRGVQELERRVQREVDNDRYEMEKMEDRVNREIFRLRNREVWVDRDRGWPRYYY